MPPRQSQAWAYASPVSPHTRSQGPSAHTSSRCAHHWVIVILFPSSGPGSLPQLCPLPAPMPLGLAGLPHERGTWHVEKLVTQPGPAPPQAPDGPHSRESPNEAVPSSLQPLICPPILTAHTLRGTSGAGHPCPLCPALAVSSEATTLLPPLRLPHGPPRGRSCRTGQAPAPGLWGSV